MHAFETEPRYLALKTLTLINPARRKQDRPTLGPLSETTVYKLITEKERVYALQPIARSSEFLSLRYSYPPTGMKHYVGFKAKELRQLDNWSKQ